MINAVITGAGGQLGQVFLGLTDQYENFEFSFLRRDTLDIRDEQAVRHLLTHHNIQAVFNAAAYTAVDKAEEEQDLAFDINASGAGTLAKVCAELGVVFVHFSTDYVFDGLKHVPYLESDPTNPTGVYGASKLAGEKAILEENADAVILRVSWLVSHVGNNFINTMIRLGKEHDQLKIVHDQVASPTSAVELAKLAIDIVLRKVSRDQSISGVFHFTHDGECSWMDLADFVFNEKKINCEAVGITTEEFGAIAPRPKYSKLNTDKLKDLMDWNMLSWQEAVQDILR